MIVGLLTKLIISIGLNAGNNPALGAANIAGLSYFWLIVLAIVAGTGSILGPWMLGKQIIRGASPGGQRRLSRHLKCNQGRSHRAI
jgi:hypothetical protein